MSEKFKPELPNELSPSEQARANELLRDSNLPSENEMFADYTVEKKETSKDFADTEPDAFDKLKSGWNDFDSFHDSQNEAADSILGGAPAKPITPGKTDEFELPQIPVAADKKPELARPTQVETTSGVRLDRNLPLEAEKRRHEARQAKKNKGFFARLFGR